MGHIENAMYRTNGWVYKDAKEFSDTLWSMEKGDFQSVFYRDANLQG